MRPHSRETAEVRRAALIGAAVASLAARGLGAASVRDVAARAGVSPGLITHHFGSFAALLAEAYRHVAAEVDGRIEAALAAAGADPEARFEAFLTVSFQPSIVDRELLSAWLGFWGLVRRDAAAAAIHAETYAAYRARLEGLLAGLVRVRPGGRAVDPRPGALGLAAMLDGLWLELCLDPSTFTPDEAVRTVRAWVDGLLGPP